MKTASKNIFPLTALLIALITGCSKHDADDAAAPAKPDAPARPGVTIDAETQDRIGLKIESPLATEWQPTLQAIGLVADPLAFTAAAADYEAARAAAVASQSELDRTQKLAAQENASSRMVEAAQAAAARDTLALKSAETKFIADWGAQLAAETNLVASAGKYQAGDSSLVKLSLPVGTFLNPPPAAATIFIFNSETNPVAADLVADLRIDPSTQVQALLFSVNGKLPPGIAVTGLLKLSGEPVSGVTVPVGAVLRHEGKGWVYEQTDTNQFERVEVPLDRLTADGWFVSENLTATNRIITTGAQTVLSAELSSGGFNTGQRD